MYHNVNAYKDEGREENNVDWPSSPRLTSTASATELSPQWDPVLPSPPPPHPQSANCERRPQEEPTGKRLPSLVSMYSAMKHQQQPAQLLVERSKKSMGG